MAQSFPRMDAQSAAEKAVSVIGFGYDLCHDARLSSCKSGLDGSSLIELEPDRSRDLAFPGGVIVNNVSSSIKCDKGERARFRSDILSFNQMSEKFNQEMSLSGKIPSGMFNAMFDFKGCWQQDAGSVKSLGYDGCFINLYNVELHRSHMTLCDQVKQKAPSTWNEAAIAEFIEKYGTHIVVGVKMGGKDVVHIKQLYQSNHQPDELQELLKGLADDRFAEVLDESILPNTTKSSRTLEDVASVYIRRGGIDVGQSHHNWLSTIPLSPNVISMSFVPITSLMTGVAGTGFINHAVNLYLRYKPPIEELQQFLEFQVPRQWAPVHGNLPGLRPKRQASPSLHFSLMGPKLFVNTSMVDSGDRPVTGVRLCLEGNRVNHLAIHLQHLSSCPPTLKLSNDQTYEPIDEPTERGYYEAVRWSILSHVCTFPVKYNGSSSASIVTKAWFEVKRMGMKKVLFLRLGFSSVASGKIRRSEWDEPLMDRNSGIFSSLSSSFSSALSTEQEEKKPKKVDINSAVYPGGPPLLKVPKQLSFLETKEVVRGPEHAPGHWVVSGAGLCVEGGKIFVRVKYSLLTVVSEDSLT